MQHAPTPTQLIACCVSLSCPFDMMLCVRPRLPAPPPRPPSKNHTLSPLPLPPLLPLTCASTAARHTCRSSVLLPPMFGPVSSMNPALSPPRETSFGTNDPQAAPAMPAGCLSCCALNTPPEGPPSGPVGCGSSSGLHMVPSAAVAAPARAMRQSSTPTASMADDHSS